MKASKKIFIILTILYAFVSVSFGQAKSVTKEIYDAAVKEAQANTDKKIRIETTIEKRFENGILTVTENLTQEYLPPDKSRWLIVETEGDKVERTEIIYIGDFEYRKIDKGEWVKKNLKSGDGAIVIKRLGKDKSVREYSLEEIKEGRETYQVYSISTVNPLAEYTTYYSEYKVWIKDGLIYKTTNSSSLNSRENVVSTSVANYDYKPKRFAIKAPVLGKKTKR